MSFHEFSKKVMEQLNQRLGDGYFVEIRKGSKNNHTVKEYLAIRKDGSQYMPMFALDDFYRDCMVHMNDLQYDKIAEQICIKYQECLRKKVAYDEFIFNARDYSKIKERIFFRLINTEKNRTWLEDKPHVAFHDLSVVFFLYVEDTRDNLCTTPINNAFALRWNVTANDLYLQALKNTPILFPSKCQDMFEVMKEIIFRQMNIPEELKHLITIERPENQMREMKYLSNVAGISGASVMLYPGVLRNYAMQQQKDLYIIPSSVDEVLLIGCDVVDSVEELTDFVRHVNMTEVPEEKRLSNHMYRYCYRDDCITIV